jgi:hypothetical protein
VRSICILKTEGVCIRYTTTTLLSKKVISILTNLSNLGSEYFDEVSCWLRSHGFIKYSEIFRSRGVTQLKDVPKVIKRSDIKKVRALKFEHLF